MNSRNGNGSGPRARQALARGQIVVRDGKGAKDRVTMLPQRLEAELREHLKRVKLLHENDLAEGFGEVWLPHALARKYPSAGKEWVWQYVFPAKGRSTDPRTGMERRHHVNDTALQRAIKDAVQLAKLSKRATCHTLRKVST